MIKVYEGIQSDFPGGHAHRSLFFDSVEAAESFEASRSAGQGGTGGGVSAPTAKKPVTPSAHDYRLGETFVGCGKGVVQGLNSLARYPWDAAWEAGTALQSAYRDRSAFWDRSVDEFKMFAEMVRNFRSSMIGDEWRRFLAKPTKEQSELWCNYFGAPGVIGASAKFAKASKLFSDGPFVPAAESAKAALTLAEIDARTSGNLLSIRRGSPAVAAAKNQEVLVALRNAGTSGTNPNRVSFLQEERVQALFKKVEENPVAGLCQVPKYEAKRKGIGFCFGRALAAHLEAINFGVEKNQIRKVWAVGDLEAEGTHWGFHVATIVRGPQGVWYALDPWMGKALTVDQWYAKMKSMDMTNDMRLFTSQASRFGPNTGKYTPSAFKNENYGGYFTDLMDNFKREAKEVVERNQTKTIEK